MALYLATYGERLRDLGVTLSKEQYALSNEKAQAAWHRRPRPLRAAGLPRGHRDVRPHRLGRHVRARRRPPLRRVLRQGERAAHRRRRHAAALHRPHEPARHGQSRGCGSTSSQVPTRRRCRRCSPRWSRTSLWVTDLEFLRAALREDARALGAGASRPTGPRSPRMYDERFCRMWEFYLISAEMMFRTGSQLVFHMQLAKQARRRTDRPRLHHRHAAAVSGARARTAGGSAEMTAQPGAN